MGPGCEGGLPKLKRYAPDILCFPTFSSVRSGKVALAKIRCEDLVDEQKSDKCAVECRKERGELGKAQSL